MGEKGNVVAGDAEGLAQQAANLGKEGAGFVAGAAGAGVSAVITTKTSEMLTRDDDQDDDETGPPAPSA